MTNDVNKPRAILCDLDGTLFLFNGRGPYDEDKCDTDIPNYPVEECVRGMWSRGLKILLTSGRHESARAKTIKCLQEYRIPYDALFMRPDVESDQRGNEEKDVIIKQRIYKNDIEPFYHVVFCLDDRPVVIRGWRELGLTCFDVAGKKEF